MSWASRRQFQYFSGFILFIAIIIFVFLFPVIFKKPICTDGKQNGTETGIDCGGSCSSMCESDISAPTILWSRALPLVGNIYNLVALIENPNKLGAIENIQYEFRIYNTNNELIGRRLGNTFIPPNRQFVIFESRFDAGEAKVKSVTFEFIPPYKWQKRITEINTLPINTENIVFENKNNNPSLSLNVKNNSIYDLPEFDVITVLYDINNNAINASKTHKKGLLSGESIPVIFTWPNNLTDMPIKKDIFILINPFSVSF